MNHNDHENDERGSVTECGSGYPESPASSDAPPTSHKTKRKVNNKKADAFDDFRKIFDEYRPLLKKHWGRAQRKFTRQHTKDLALVWREHDPIAQEYERFDFAFLFAVVHFYAAYFSDVKEEVNELLRVGMRMSVWLAFRTRLNLDRRQASYGMVRAFAVGQVLLWLLESVLECVGKA